MIGKRKPFRGENFAAPWRQVRKRLTRLPSRLDVCEGTSAARQIDFAIDLIKAALFSLASPPPRLIHCSVSDQKRKRHKKRAVRREETIRSSPRDFGTATNSHENAVRVDEKK